MSETDKAAPYVVEPDPRVLFAAERTLLAWIRTGVALMGFGFVVARFGLFLRQFVSAQKGSVVPPSPFSVWVGIGLVVLGIVVNGAAARSYLHRLGRINRGESLFPASPSPGVLVAAALASVGFAIAVYLFLVAH